MQTPNVQIYCHCDVFWRESALKLQEGPFQNLMFCWDSGGQQSPITKVHFSIILWQTLLWANLLIQIWVGLV